MLRSQPSRHRLSNGLSNTIHFFRPKSRPSFSSPSPSTSSLLALCSTTRVLRQVHARFVLHGLHRSPSLSSALVARYGDLGHPDLALKVFDSVIDGGGGGGGGGLLYTSIIRTMSVHGHPERALLLYRRGLLHGSLRVDDGLACCSFLIRSCLDLPCAGIGEMFRCHAAKLGFNPGACMCGSTAGFTGGHCETRYACYSFDGMHLSDAPVTSSSAWEGDQNGSFGLERMRLQEAELMRLQETELTPSGLVGLLRSCLDLNKDSRAVKSVHAIASVSGLVRDLSVATTLLTTYSKLGALEMARLLFASIVEKDRAVWNSMISGYTLNGCSEQALNLLVQMSNKGFRTDMFTAIASLSAAADLKSLKFGREIHGHVVRNGSDNQVAVHNALIDMYCKCKRLVYARKVFDMVMDKTVVSWSTMIKGYLNNDHPSDAMLLFDEMRMEGVKPDSIMVINILPACVQLGALQRVQGIHSYVVKQGFIRIISLVTALLVSYAKCGCIEMAKKIFDEEEIGQKDIISWNSMIAAYSKHGNSSCFDLYHQMTTLGITPDNLTFLGLLTICVNSGLVIEGRQFFHEMVDIYRLKPEKEHYACMVDLFGRAGLLDEAVMLIEAMPFKPDAQIWGPLLSACKLHSNAHLAELAAERLIDLEPENPGNYVLLSNIYAASGKWHQVAKMRSFLRNGGMKKNAGCSWLEINGLVHEFRVADQSHPDSKDIYALLRNVEQETKIDDGVGIEVYC